MHSMIWNVVKENNSPASLYTEPRIHAHKNMCVCMYMYVCRLCFFSLGFHFYIFYLIYFLLHGFCPIDSNMFLSDDMDSWSLWTHNQCYSVYTGALHIHSYRRCYLLSSHVMWQLPQVPHPPGPLHSCFSWESGPAGPKKPGESGLWYAFLS